MDALVPSEPLIEGLGLFLKYGNRVILDHVDIEVMPGEIVTTLRENVDIDSALSNSFGFGGTNATLVLSKYLD